MKKTLLVLFTLVSSFLTFAGNWPGVCENLTFTYDMQPTTDALKYEMTVVITNTGTTDLGSYCDVFESLTPGVTLNGFPNCYPSLAAGDTKEILFDVNLTDANTESFELSFKAKDGIDEDLYCKEVKRFWLGDALSIEEIDRTDMPYTSTYYDIMGREVKALNQDGFFIERKRYEDGYEVVEKLYYTAQ